MTLSVLIVDDEPLALDRLRLAFRTIDDARIVGHACDGEEAVALAAKLTPDLIMLDVQMPKVTGIEAAKALRQFENTPEIVFLTAFGAYASDAFDVEAADYLLKPVRIDRLRAAISRAKRRIDARRLGERIDELELILHALRAREHQPVAKQAYDTEIWAPRRGGLSRVPIGNVIWIEAAGDYLLVHTLHSSFMMHQTMAGLAKRLDPTVMLRAHRSAFVNRYHIESAERIGRDGICLTLSTGAEVRVGANYRAAIQAALKGPIPNRRRNGQGEAG